MQEFSKLSDVGKKALLEGPFASCPPKGYRWPKNKTVVSRDSGKIVLSRWINGKFKSASLSSSDIANFRNSGAGGEMVTIERDVLPNVTSTILVKEETLKFTATELESVKVEPKNLWTSLTITRKSTFLDFGVAVLQPNNVWKVYFYNCPGGLHSGDQSHVPGGHWHHVRNFAPNGEFYVLFACAYGSKPNLLAYAADRPELLIASRNHENTAEQFVAVSLNLSTSNCIDFKSMAFGFGGEGRFMAINVGAYFKSEDVCSEARKVDAPRGHPKTLAELLAKVMEDHRSRLSATALAPAKSPPPQDSSSVSDGTDTDEEFAAPKIVVPNEVVVPDDLKDVVRITNESHIVGLIETPSTAMLGHNFPDEFGSVLYGVSPETIPNDWLTELRFTIFCVMLVTDNHHLGSMDTGQLMHYGAELIVAYTKTTGKLMLIYGNPELGLGISGDPIPTDVFWSLIKSKMDAPAKNVSDLFVPRGDGSEAEAALEAFLA